MHALRSSIGLVATTAVLFFAIAAISLAAPVPAIAAVASTASGGASSNSSGSLEQAAKRAGDTARTVAMYLIGAAFAAGAVILIFKRDFREAATIFGVGLLAILLATPAGVDMLQSTVNTLFH